MANRKRTPAEIFSYATIALSLALLAGLGLGHTTRQALHPKLAANLPDDPVERYELGQNAYKAPRVRRQPVQAQPAQYADASHEIGRYKNGARLLTPEEPARKIDRLQLERLQAWNEENFGGGNDPGDRDYARIDDYAPIDVGAVKQAAETRSAGQQFAMADSGI